MKEKRYKKAFLRERLVKAMGQEVTPMEFSRWLRYYCEIKGLPEAIMQAKEIPESVVSGFGEWLGYPF